MYSRNWNVGSFFRLSVVRLFIPLTFFCVISAGCLRGDALKSATNETRGGIRYDAAAPLEAVVKPQFDAKDPPTLSYVYAVTYEGGEGSTVPALYAVPVRAEGKIPAIILLHGLGGRKEDMAILSVALARRGYASLSLDIAGHGERPPIHGKSVEKFNRADLHLAAGQTIADLRRAVDFLVRRPEIDANRIGFVGASIGGIIGGVFAADEPRLRGIVLWSAGGDWGTLLTTSQHPWAKSYREGNATATQIENDLRDVDPADALAQSLSFAPRPLLLINGDKDTIVPAYCADKLFAAAKNPKKRIILPGGHLPDLPTMANETLLFLDANVKNANKSAKSAPLASAVVAP